MNIIRIKIEEDNSQKSEFLFYDSFYKKMNKYYLENPIFESKYVKQKFCIQNEQRVPADKIIDEMYKKSGKMYPKEYFEKQLIKLGYIQQEYRFVKIPIQKQLKKDNINKIKNIVQLFFNRNDYKGQILFFNKNKIQIEIQDSGLDDFQRFLQQNKIKYDI